MLLLNFIRARGKFNLKTIAEEDFIYALTAIGKSEFFVRGKRLLYRRMLTIIHGHYPGVYQPRFLSEGRHIVPVRSIMGIEIAQHEYGLASRVGGNVIGKLEQIFAPCLCRALRVLGRSVQVIYVHG